MVCAGRGGRHSSSVFGSSSSSQTKAESFRHFSRGRGLRLSFGRGPTQPTTSPCRGDNLVLVLVLVLVLGFTATAGWGWLSRLHRGWW